MKIPKSNAHSFFQRTIQLWSWNSIITIYYFVLIMLNYIVLNYPETLSAFDILSSFGLLLILTPESSGE